MDLLRYNIKLLFYQWNVLVFPLAITVLTILVLYESSVKSFSTLFLFESFSSLILGIITIDALFLERKLKLSEITTIKLISPVQVFLVRWALILLYGVSVLFFLAIALIHSTDFFRMRMFVGAMITVLFLCNFGFFLSSFLDPHLSTIGIFVVLFMGNGIISQLTEKLGEDTLLFFPSIVTFFPEYEYFWQNRILFTMFSFIFLMAGIKLMENTERQIG